MTKDKRTSVYFDRENLCFIGLDNVHIKHLKDIFKGIDVDIELKKMSLWLTSSKGKTRKGNIGFIINWLKNASTASQVLSNAGQLDSMEYDSPLRPLLLEYLKDLWKGKEHILEFNKIKKEN